MKRPTFAHHAQKPSRQIPGETSPAWISRGAHFVVVVSSVKDGDTLARETRDEHVLIVPETQGLSIRIRAGGETVHAQADSLTIIPPGPSTLAVEGCGLIARVFTSDESDLLALADNHEIYASIDPDVADATAWPAPADGFHLRHYKLADYISPENQMRVFRTCKLMINPLLKRVVPRDVRKLSPHSHADFEQGSLALNGTYVHHLRYPWGPDMTQWQPDDAVEMKSPSLLVVPPKVIHTSRNIDANGILVDIFSPPRIDFEKRGIVCNSKEYPPPEHLLSA